LLLADQESNRVTAVRSAVAERDIEIAEKLLSIGDSLDKVAMVTGLTSAEVEKLRNAD